tara:strand:- start:364 stop:675 length:312 start_codon:yes stop_codon:yes gene_type:complete
MFEVDYFNKKVRNNKKLAGQLAGKKEFFGKHDRFAIAPVHTRFAYKIDWFCWDAEKLDKFGLPEVIGQKDSYREAREFVIDTLTNDPKEIRETEELLSRLFKK